MIIFPALDLQAGKAVRLKRGKRDDVTVFGDDPLQMAKYWQAQGTNWLHIVDLDAAFDGQSDNTTIIKNIAASPGLRTQVGGGIRSLEKAASYLEAGVTRLIIGTMALEKPQLFGELCHKFPGKIGVSLDASNGILKSRGWVEDTNLKVKEILPQLEELGAAYIIYTDIERDGMKSGVNLSALADILAATELPVIVAGGVSTLEDVKELNKLDGNLEGVISGRALYEKTLDLKEALDWLSRN